MKDLYLKKCTNKITSKFEIKVVSQVDDDFVFDTVTLDDISPETLGYLDKLENCIGRSDYTSKIGNNCTIKQFFNAYQKNIDTIKKCYNHVFGKEPHSVSTVSQIGRLLIHRYDSIKLAIYSGQGG